MKVYEPIDYTDGDEYITFTAEGAIPGFSFEYPSDYKLYSYQPMPGFLSTSVFLSNIDYGNPVEIVDGRIISSDRIEPPPEAEWDFKNARIYIHKVGRYFHGAEAAANEAIAEYKWLVRAGYSEDFKLLEKNRVTVGGMEGWEIVVSYTILPDAWNDLDDAGTRTRAVPVVNRELFFDAQDAVWQISIDSDAENADQAKLDYEHILETLRILE